MAFQFVGRYSQNLVNSKGKERYNKAPTLTCPFLQIDRSDQAPAYEGPIRGPLVENMERTIGNNSEVLPCSRR